LSIGFVPLFLFWGSVCAPLWTFPGFSTLQGYCKANRATISTQAKDSAPELCLMLYKKVQPGTALPSGLSDPAGLRVL